MNADIVARLRFLLGKCNTAPAMAVWSRELREAADEIERLRAEVERLRDELAARCGDARPGAHTAGPSETFIPEAL